MSAFIVSNQCMNNIVPGLHHAQKDPEFQTYHPTLTFTKEQLTAMAKAWYAINVQAMKARYGKGLTIDELNPEFEWVSTDTPPTREQTLKSMRCLRYQCNEGNVDQTQQYKDLEALIERWADWMVENSDNYKNAVWD